jgi:VanZ family protein
MIQNKKASFIFYNVSAVLVLTGIVYLSLTSRPVELYHADNFDKVQHGFAYAVLAVFTFLALDAWGLGQFKSPVVFLFCSFIGGGLEILQFYSGRMMDLNDFIADTVGAITGILIIRFFLRVFR